MILRDHRSPQVAKAMAPSVVYIDEVDLVFRDGQGRRRADSGAARIRRDLVAQVKPSNPGGGD